MTRTKIFSRVLLLLLTLSMVLSSFSACKSDKKEGDDEKEPTEGLLDISGYTIVREDATYGNVVLMTRLT